MLYFFYYAEFRVSGHVGICCADGTMTLPLNTDLIFLDQYVRDFIQKRNPKVVRSSIVLKCVSRLGEATNV